MEESFFSKFKCFTAAAGPKLLAMQFQIKKISVVTKHALLGSHLEGLLKDNVHA